MGITLNMFNEKFAELPSYQQEIISAAFGESMPSDPEKTYKQPSQLSWIVIKKVNNAGRQDLLNVCGRCGGTGLYDSYTSYTDAKGRPICFKCNGSGLKLKKLSSKKLKEVTTLFAKSQSEQA